MQHFDADILADINKAFYFVFVSDTGKQIIYFGKTVEELEKHMKELYEEHRFFTIHAVTSTVNAEFFICRKCGNKLFKSTYAQKIMQELEKLDLCFSCKHWFDWCNRDKTDTNSVVINGNHYHISQDAVRGDMSFSGFSGREFTIKFNDGRTIVTHNMWHQGDIPDIFLKDFPDNAVFG